MSRIVLSEDYDDRPSAAEAAREDVLHPPAGPCTVTRDVGGRRQVCFKSAGHRGSHVAYSAALDPFATPDSWGPYEVTT